MSSRDHHQSLLSAVWYIPSTTMKLTIGCSLLCVTLLVLVQMSGSDATSDSSSDLYLSRHKRGFFDDLIDELVTKFSKTISKILKLDPKDFETFIRSLGRISKTLARNILKKFLELKDKNYDFGTRENFERVSAMMDTLDEVDQRQETSGASSVSWSTALCLSLLGQIVHLL